MILRHCWRFVARRRTSSAKLVNGIQFREIVVLRRKGRIRNARKH
jgi:hypothetical protein